LTQHLGRYGAVLELAHTTAIRHVMLGVRRTAHGLASVAPCRCRAPS